MKRAEERNAGESEEEDRVERVCVVVEEGKPHTLVA